MIGAWIELLEEPAFLTTEKNNLGRLVLNIDNFNSLVRTAFIRGKKKPLLNSINYAAAQAKLMKNQY